jgi:hypothetical protein
MTYFPSLFSAGAIRRGADDDWTVELREEDTGSFVFGVHGAVNRSSFSLKTRSTAEEELRALLKSTIAGLRPATR